MAKRKEYIGIVLSNNMQKTIVVKVARMAKHPKYGRIIKIANKFKVHDEKNTAKPGDEVRIREVRPISKEKRFALIAVVKKAAVVHAQIKDELSEIIKTKKKVSVQAKEAAPEIIKEGKESKAKEKEAPQQ